MGDQQVTLDQLEALESNLRAFETDLISLRKMVASAPNYSGDWRETPVWKNARRRFRVMCLSAKPTLYRRQNK